MIHLHPTQAGQAGQPGPAGQHPPPLPSLPAPPPRSGMPPFWGETEKDIFQCILRGTLDLQTAPWPSISAEAKDLVTRILTPDPEYRPTAEALLQHPWLREHGVAPDRPLDSVVIQRMKNFARMTKLKKVGCWVGGRGMFWHPARSMRAGGESSACRTLPR